MNEKIFIKLFLGPLLLAVAGGLILFIFGQAPSGQAANSPLVQQVHLHLSKLIWIISAVLIGTACVQAAAQYYHYWRYAAGHDPACPRCGAMMRMRSGRYGHFWGCIRYPSCKGTDNHY